MKIALLTIGTLMLSSKAFTQKQPAIKTGQWIGKLQITQEQTLPFNMEIAKSKDNYSITILNGEEEIEIKNVDLINDTFHVVFPIFNTEIVFKPVSKKEIVGTWINHNKEDYAISFTGIHSDDNRFTPIKSSTIKDFSGKWETVFSKDGQDAYPALGVFNQKGNHLSGTFLTETGDYRFLDGNVYGNKLYLSCFDGSHAFMFTAEEDANGELSGKFYSGKHWESEWFAKHNESYSLPNPDSITFVKQDAKKLSFEVKDLKGNKYNYPNPSLKDKVVIIQIMGTWCPNCLDETAYFKELYDQYHAQGLEIISIGYEVGTDFNKHVERITTFKNKLNLDFTFLVGGAANKGVASQHFSALNEVVSFPTSIFIDRTGEIRRIHTGFNGPGTGEYYIEYVEKTNELIKELITE